MVKIKNFGHFPLCSILTKFFVYIYSVIKTQI